MSRVAVVGAGTMGNGIAHVFAQHGWDTTLIDVAPGLLERVLAVIRTNLERQVRSEEHTSELQSRPHIVCRLLLEKKKNMQYNTAAKHQRDDINHECDAAKR